MAEEEEEAETAAKEETKLCNACSNQLSRDAFSKKQWMHRSRRRCKACVDANQEIVLNASGKDSSATSSKSGAPKPQRAADQQRLKANDEAAHYYFAPMNICGWCGKAEGELMRCSKCRNTKFCSAECQKAAWPEHKEICSQLRLDRKEAHKLSKKGGANKKPSEGGPGTWTEASGTGSVAVHSNPGTMSLISYTGELCGPEQPGHYFATERAEASLCNFFGLQKLSRLKEQMASQTYAERNKQFTRVEYYHKIDDLTELDQFLLSCGTFNDLGRAKAALPYVLARLTMSGRTPDGRIPDLGDITVRGYGLTALDWAARRGNYEVAEWLATDLRTRVLLTRGAPVAWACYTNKVELAKVLVRHGADSRATSDVVFGKKPPTHLAAENGQLLALKYLVEDCGHDIAERDTLGQNIRTAIRRNSPNWNLDFRLVHLTMCQSMASSLVT